MKKRRGSDGLNVIQKIAAGDYTTFGMFLLRDLNGEKVDLLKKKYHSQGQVAEGITKAILAKWLKHGPTRTYQHLIKCIRDSELGALADNIAEWRATAAEGKSAHT